MLPGPVCRRPCGRWLKPRHRSTVDVVLLDVRMPRLDGPQTLVALHQISPAVHCVFMTGNIGGYTAEQVRARGAARHARLRRRA
jgi:CheY-like chemotaxis protein